MWGGGVREERIVDTVSSVRFNDFFWIASANPVSCTDVDMVFSFAREYGFELGA